VLTLGGFADDPQKKRLGTFYATRDSVEGRPVYQNRATGDYMYFYAQKNWWLIGPHVGSATAGLLVQDEAMYPADIKGDFFAFDAGSGKWTKTNVDKSCARMPLLDVRFTLLAHDCSAVDAKAIEEAPLMIHKNADRLAATLDESGVHAATVAVLGKVALRGCEPEIFLHLGAPTNAVQLPKSHCHFDGSRVTVRHTQRTAHHDAFSCNHRFDATANAWQCSCNSWVAADAHLATTGAPAPKGKKAAIVPTANPGKAPTKLAAPAVDCELGMFSLWTPCTKACKGTQTRSRHLIRHALNGGRACAERTETRACNTVCATKADCELAAWSAWTACSKTCGGGVAKRSRTVLNQPTAGGKACSVTAETVKCATEHCQAHYVPEQHRMANDPYNNWWNADAAVKKAMPRYTKFLPAAGCCIACTTGAPCGKVCIDKNAVCDKDPERDSWCACHKDVHAAVEKDNLAASIKKVAETVCKPGQHIVHSSPNLCNECPAGTFQSKENQRDCLICPVGQAPNLVGGATGCIKAATKFTKDQKLDVFDCVVGQWPFKIAGGKKASLWTPCTAGCGGGSQYRERRFVQPINGGKACPHEKEYRTCNTHACAPGTTDATDPKSDNSAYNQYVHSREEQSIELKGKSANLFYTAPEAAP
jgi:hypothetical protein